MSKTRNNHYVPQWYQEGFAERKQELDPLAVLQEGSFEGGKEGGQMNMFRLVPNFEMTMYLAQATGACIVTDRGRRRGSIRR